MNPVNTRHGWATLLLLSLAVSSAPSQGLARSVSKFVNSAPWSPSHQCVKELRDTDISPTTRGPTAAETYTYEKKYDDIDDCFKECQSHFIAYSKNSGRCYCWREQSCQAVGFCDDGDCPGEPFGTWGSDSSMVVYDQSGCYGDPCVKYTGMNDSSDSEEDDSSDSEEEKDSSDSEEEDASSGANRGPWSPSHQCVKELRDTDISPTTRGPTAAETYTYEEKYDDIDDCFKECQSHFIAYSKNSGRCYCWREQSCQAVGFCDDGDCPGEPFGTWGSERSMVVYDQSGCYGDPCEKYIGMGDSSDSEEEKDSSDSEEDKSDNDDTKGPWNPCEEGEPCADDQYREECDFWVDSVSSNQCVSMLGIASSHQRCHQIIPPTHDLLLPRLPKTRLKVLCLLSFADLE